MYMHLLPINLCWRRRSKAVEKDTRRYFEQIIYGDCENIFESESFFFSNKFDVPFVIKIDVTLVYKKTTYI